MKSERLDLRLTKEQLKAIKLAAALEGLSVSSFVAQASTEKAHQKIERHKMINLTLAQHEEFMRACDETAKRDK